MLTPRKTMAKKYLQEVKDEWLENGITYEEASRQFSRIWNGRNLVEFPDGSVIRGKDWLSTVIAVRALRGELQL